MHHETSSLPAYACHVTRTWSRDTHSTMEESCFEQKFSSEEDDHLLLEHPFLTGKKKSSNLSVGLKN